MTEDNSYLWHYRYSHLSFKDHNILVKKYMVKGLPTLKELNNICSDYVIRKQQSDVIYKQALWKATSKLELIQPYIC